MLRLIGLVVSIGLADSLNPTTIVPAMYLATGERPRLRVLQFTLGVLITYFVGGALIALGPGQLLISLVNRPTPHVRHLIETAVGGALLLASAMLYRYRSRLAQTEIPDTSRGRSSAILGATITAVELPTAFPYFAVIAAIVGSGVGLPGEIGLLLLFNACFVLPLVGIMAVLALAPDRSQRLLGAAREFLQRRWPVVLSVLLLLAGVFVTLLGVAALTGHGHSRFGRFMRGVHGVLHP